MITIGDPGYLEELEQEEGTINPRILNNMRKMTLIGYKPRVSKVGSVTIKKVHCADEEDGFEWDSIYIDIFLAKDEAQLKVYEDDKFFKNTIKEKRELGCDSASFIMDVDGRYEEFDTGADGYYGTVELMKEYFGFRMFLSLDADLFSMDDTEKTMKYLFKEVK